MIACNTAHILLPQLAGSSQAAFVSLIDETVLAIAKRGVRCVGVMGTPTTITTGLYHKPLEDQCISVVEPSGIEAERLEVAIRRTIAIGEHQEAKNTALGVESSLEERGAEAVLLGCTELSLLYGPASGRIDPMDIAIQKLLEEYYGR